MKTYTNTIRIITDLSLAKLASGSQAEQRKFISLLNDEGDLGWQPYHLEDSAKGLMVFLTQESDDSE